MNSYYSNTRPELVAVVPDKSNTILDVGCGIGAMSSSIKSHISPEEIWGVEIVENIAEKARLNSAFKHVLVGSIEDLVCELPENYFDCIIAGDVLEHLINPWDTLLALKKCLKPGGVFICTIPNIANLSFILRILFTGSFKYKNSGVLDRTHLRFFGKKDMVDMFKAADFINIQIQAARPKKQLIKRLGQIVFGRLSIKVFMILAYKE